MREFISVFKSLTRLGFAPTPDPQVESPEVIIEPVESLIQEAVKRIRQKDPNYFKGVRKIVSGPESAYGHVESGPGKDPHVIHLNFPRIKAELQGKFQGKELEEAVIDELIHTIAHEKGHIKGMTETSPHFGNEGQAEQEADRVSGLFGKKP